VEVAVDLAARQLGLLVVLTALGSGPATYLPQEVPAIARIAVAPAFGLALGAAILVSAAYLMPMSTGAWVVLTPLALGSVAFAVHRARRGKDGPLRPAGREAAVTAALALAVIAALDAPLIARNSLGPMGFELQDSGYQTAQRLALEDHRLGDLGITYELAGPRRENPAVPGLVAFPRSERREVADLYERQWKYVPAGVPVVAAGVDVLFGWNGVDTQSAFLGVLVLAAALAGFALALYITGSIWAALLAGLLFAGPVGYQLYVESAEPSRGAIALISAMFLVGALLLRRLDASLLFLLGLLLAGLIAVYAVWVPIVALAALAVLACLAAARWRRGELRRPEAVRVIAGLGAAAVLAVALTPFASVRGLQFAYLAGATDFLRDVVRSGIVGYHLTAVTVPGWLLQMREVYSLPGPDLGDPRGLARGFVLPALLLALAVFGAWRFRHRGALLLLAPVPVAAVLAYHVVQRTDGCSYCAQRQLAILEPSSAVLLAAGLAALPLAGNLRPFARIPDPERALSVAAVLLALLVLVLAAQRSQRVQQRSLEGHQIFDPRVRALANRLNAGSGPVLLEFNGEGGVGMPATFWAVGESSETRPALEPATEGFGSVVSFYDADEDLRVGSRADYRLVLTRMRGIETGRRAVATSGAYALQARAHPYDASLVSGALADPAHDDRGLAWVQREMTFSVASDTRRPAWLRLELTGPGVAALAVGDGARLRRRGDRAEICVAVPGRSALREVDVPLSFEQLPPAPAPERYALAPLPGKALRLAGMRASGRACTAPSARSQGRRR
jgi:hypothetical protein